MKILIFALLVVGFVAVVVTESEESNKHWEEFKKLHGKSYSPEEDALRKELFSSHKAIVNLHNEKYARGEVPYSIGINQFSDMTESEINQHFGARFEKPQIQSNNDENGKEKNQRYFGGHFYMPHGK